MFANMRLSCGSSSGSLDSMTNAGAPVVEFHDGVEETESDGSQMPVETKGFNLYIIMTAQKQRLGLRL
jgi:hypothetical protein